VEELVALLREMEKSGKKTTNISPELIKKFGGYMCIIQVLHNDFKYHGVSYITEEDIIIKWF